MTESDSLKLSYYQHGFQTRMMQLAMKRSQWPDYDMEKEAGAKAIARLLGGMAGGGGGAAARVMPAAAARWGSGQFSRGMNYLRGLGQEFTGAARKNYYPAAGLPTPKAPRPAPTPRPARAAPAAPVSKTGGPRGKPTATPGLMGPAYDWMRGVAGDYPGPVGAGAGLIGGFGASQGLNMYGDYKKREALRNMGFLGRLGLSGQLLFSPESFIQSTRM